MATAKELDSATLLSAIVDDSHIACLVVTLCEALDADPAEIRRAARDLVKRGVVAHWPECPDGPAICLCPSTAEQLQLEPDDSGRWVPRGSRQRPDRLPSGRAARECDLRDDGVSVFNDMPDLKAIAPPKVADYNEQLRVAVLNAEEAIRFEPKWSAYRAEAINEVRFKIPQRIVGLSPIWPVEQHIEGERCVCCRHIRGSFVCIVCNSSSVDAITGKPPTAAQLERQAGRALKVDSRGLKGGTDGRKARAGR